MNNDIIIENPWWKRNIVWLILTIMLIILVGAGSMMFRSGNMEFYALANADPSFYKVALDSANKNQKVLEKFGYLNPIDDNGIYEGKAFYSNNKNSLNIILQVDGKKAEGTMNLWLQRHSQGWKYDSIVIKNNTAKVVVIKTDSTNHQEP